MALLVTFGDHPPDLSAASKGFDLAFIACPSLLFLYFPLLPSSSLILIHFSVLVYPSVVSLSVSHRRNS